MAVTSASLAVRAIQNPAYRLADILMKGRPAQTAGRPAKFLERDVFWNAM
jgi:hypothetical protein